MSEAAINWKEEVCHAALVWYVKARDADLCRDPSKLVELVEAANHAKTAAS
jgi:hypothetical protein